MKIIEDNGWWSWWLIKAHRYGTSKIMFSCPDEFFLTSNLEKEREREQESALAHTCKEGSKFIPVLEVLIRFSFYVLLPSSLFHFKIVFKSSQSMYLFNISKFVRKSYPSQNFLLPKVTPMNLAGFILIHIIDF